MVALGLRRRQLARQGLCGVYRVANARGLARRPRSPSELPPRLRHRGETHSAQGPAALQGRRRTWAASARAHGTGDKVNSTHSCDFSPKRSTAGGARDRAAAICKKRGQMVMKNEHPKQPPMQASRGCSSVFIEPAHLVVMAVCCVLANVGGRD